MTCLSSSCSRFYLLAAAALRLLNIWDIGHDFFIFIIHKNLLFAIKKAPRNDLRTIKMPMQQVPYASTAIARDLVSAFGPLLYGPHSY